MIHYHGMPLSGTMQQASRFLTSRHAFVSFAAPECLPLVAEACQSFALDNGAFSAWKAGRPTDWPGYYEWVREWHRHPGFDWAVIPDVIDGTERDNDELVTQWATSDVARHGVPVWHLHESADRLARLCGAWPRVALGSSGAWRTPGTQDWWDRMAEVLPRVTDGHGRPVCKLHGLRMLDPDVFTRIPLSSADSTNAAINSGYTEVRWGPYCPKDNWQRAEVIACRIEAQNAAPRWAAPDRQKILFA
jgi:hypothetical protein